MSRSWADQLCRKPGISVGENDTTMPMIAIIVTSRAITMRTAIPADRTSERNKDMAQVSLMRAGLSGAGDQRSAIGLIADNAHYVKTTLI
jgi:hypothetical protein